MTVAKIVINGSMVERLDGMSMVGRSGEKLIYNKDGYNISVDLGVDFDSPSSDDNGIDTTPSHIEEYPILSETDAFPEISDDTYPLILREKNGKLAFRLNPLDGDMNSIHIRNSEGEPVQSLGSNITDHKDWTTLPVGSTGDREYDSEYTISISNSTLDIKVELSYVTIQEDNDDKVVIKPNEILTESDESKSARQDRKDKRQSKDPEVLVNKIKKLDNISEIDDLLDDMRDLKVNFNHSEFNTINDVHEPFRLMNECSSYKRMAKYARKFPEEANLRPLAMTFMINNIIERTNKPKKNPFENICRNLMNISDEHYLHSGDKTRRVDIRIIDPLMNHLNTGLVQAKYDEIKAKEGNVDPSKLFKNLQPPKLLKIDEKIMDIYNNADVIDPEEKGSSSKGNKYLDANNPNTNDNNSITNKTESQLNPVELKTRDINKFMRQARTTKELFEFIHNGSRSGWVISDSDANIEDVKKTVEEIKNIGSNNSIQEFGSKVRERFPTDVRNIRTMINTFVVSKLAKEYMHNIRDDKMREDTISRYNKYSEGLQMSPDQIEIYKKNRLSEFIDILDPDTPENTTLDPKSEIVRRSFSMVEFQEKKGDRREIHEKDRQNIDPYSGIQKSEVSEGVIDKSTSGNLPEDIGAIDDIDRYRKTSLLVDYTQDEIEQKLIHSVSVDPKIGDSDDTFSDLAEHLNNIQHGTENFGDSIQRLKNKSQSYEQNSLEVLSYYTISNIIQSASNEKSIVSGIKKVRNAVNAKLRPGFSRNIDLILESIENDKEDTNLNRIPNIVKEEIEVFNDAELDVEESESTEFNFIGGSDQFEDTTDQDVSIQKDDIEENVMKSVLSEPTVKDMREEIKSRIGSTPDNVDIQNIEIGNVELETFFEKLIHKNGENPGNTIVKNDMPNNLSHIALTVEISKILDQYSIIVSQLEKDMKVYAEKARYAVDIKSDEPFSHINSMIRKIYGVNVDERNEEIGIEKQLTRIKQSDSCPSILRNSLEDYNIGDSVSDESDERQTEQDIQSAIDEAIEDSNFMQESENQQESSDDMIEIDEIKDSTLSAILSESTVDKMEKEASRRLAEQNDSLEISNIEVSGVNLQNFFKQLKSQNIQNPDNTVISIEHSHNLSLIAFTVEVSKIISSKNTFNQSLVDDLTSYRNNINNDLLDIDGEEPYSTIKGIIRQADNSPQDTKNSLEMVQNMPNAPKILRESISRLSEPESANNVVEVESEERSGDTINNEFI